MEGFSISPSDSPLPSFALPLFFTLPNSPLPPLSLSLLSPFLPSHSPFLPPSLTFFHSRSPSPFFPSASLPSPSLPTSPSPFLPQSSLIPPSQRQQTSQRRYARAKENKLNSAVPVFGDIARDLATLSNWGRIRRVGDEGERGREMGKGKGFM